MRASKNRQKLSPFTKKRRKLQAAASRSMQVESLEDRRLLAVTNAVFSTPFSGLVEDPSVAGTPAATAALIAAGQPYLTVTVGSTTGAGEKIFLAQTPSPATDAEASDFSLANVELPVGLAPGTYTMGLIDNTISTSTLLTTGGLTVNDDAFIEGTELVGASVVAVGYTTVPGAGESVSHVHSILDEEAAEVSLATAVVEGDLSVAATLTQTAGDAGATLEDSFISVLQDLTVGTAMTPADYSFTSQPVVFPAGTAAGAVVSVSLPTVDDSLAEPTETVDLAFTDGGTTPITPGSHSPSYVAIGNDDVAIVDNEVVTVGFSTGMQMIDEDDPFGDNLFDVVVTISGSGSGPFVLQDPLTVPITVGGSATGGTASSLDDYEIIAPIPASPLMFAAGSGSTTVPFYIETESGASGVLDDSILEGDENVTLDLITAGTVAGAGILPTGYELIIKDDEVGSIVLTKTDGDEGTSDVTFTATLTAPATGPGAPTSIAPTISLPYTLGGTALAVFDYGTPAPASPLTFAGTTCVGTAPCVVTATLTVPVVDDMVLEPTETVVATFSGSSLLPAASTISADILDNDLGVASIVVTDMMGIEDDATLPTPDDQVGFDVVIDKAASVAVTATIDLDPSTAASLTATSGIDFAAIFPVTVVFPAYDQAVALVPANTVQSVTVQILDETDIPLPFEIVELTEELVVEITSVTTPSPVGDAGGGYSVAAQLDGRLDGGAVGTPLVGDQMGPRTLLIKDDPGDIAKVHVLSAATFGGDEDAAEPSDNGNFTAVLLDTTGTTLVMTSFPIDVVIAPLTGTATLGADYSVSPGGPTYTIPAGSFSTPINVIVIDDTIVEPLPHETVVTSLVSHVPVLPGGYVGPIPTVMDGNPGVPQTVEIEDNDSIKVVISATDDNLKEDTPTNLTGTFRVELLDGSGGPITQPSATPFTIDFSGTALFAALGLNPDDYDVTYATQGGATGVVPGTTFPFAIPAGDQWVDFTITDAVGTDLTVEGTETVIGKVTGAPGPDTTATVTIDDDDSATVKVKALADAVEDSVVGTADGKFEFYLSAPSDSDTVVTFTTTGGTINPASSTDYTVINTSPGAPTVVQVKIPAFTSGMGLATNPMITFDGTQDVLVEGTESVKASVASVDSGHASITPGTPDEAFITDDDGTFVGVMAMDDTAYEDPTATSPKGLLTFNVGDLIGTPNPNVTTDLTVNYIITGAGITPGDYMLSVVGQTPAPGVGGVGTATLGSSSVVIPAGVTSVDVQVMAIDDAIVEGSETLMLSLVSISTPFTIGAAINPLKAADSVAIIDDDSAEVFLTHQAISGGTLPDENAFEEGCVVGVLTSASGLPLQTGCVGTGPTNDNVVPFIVGLTAPSSTATTVTFLAGGPGTSTADAEFEDFDIVLPGFGVLPGGVLDPVSGLETYTAVIPALTQFVTLEIHAVNDNDPANFVATGATTTGGVVEGTELVVTRLLPTAQGGASSNPAYANSASTFEELTKIHETDVAVLTVTDHTLVESDPPVGATVTLHTDIEGQLNVDFATVDLAAGSTRPPGGVSANAGSDYTDNDGLFPAFVNSPAGATNVVDLSAPWFIDAINDGIGEPTEYYDLTLAGIHNNAGLVDTSDVGLVTILDDDVISVSVSAASIVEGDTPDTTKVTFTVNLDDSNQAIPAGVLTWSTSDISTVTGGSLAAGKDDYVPQTAITIPWLGTKFDAGAIPGGIGTVLSNGDKTLTFDVVINGDDVVEGDQKFDVDFDFTPALPSGAPVQTATQTITIEDDDTANIRVTSVFDPVTTATNGDTTIVVPEGPAPSDADVDIFLDKAIEGTLTILAATSDGTATMDLAAPVGPDNDYVTTAVPSGSPLTFTDSAPGAFVDAFFVPINEDTIVEGTEKFNIDVTIVGFVPFGSSVVVPPPAAFNAAGGEVAITDNDDAKIAITPDTLSVLETAGVATFTAELLADVSTSPSATTGVQDAFSFDAITTQNLLFGGQACGDDSHMVLSCPGGDYDFMTLIPGDMTVTFPESVDLDGDGDLEVPVGTTVTFSVPINDDNIIELSELFQVELDPATFAGANAGDQAISIVPAATTTGMQEITIIDDDALKGAVVELRSPTDANPEGTAPGVGTNGSFEIGLTGGLVTDVDITVTMGVTGTATPIVDFDIPGSVPSFSSSAPTLLYTIPAGSNSVTADVVPVPDGIIEPNETVIPTITPTGVIPSPARPGIGNAANSVTVNIIDDDSSTITTRDFFVRGSSWGNTTTGYVAASRPIATLGDTVSQFNVDTFEVVYNTAPTATPILLLTGTTSAGTPAAPIAVSAASVVGTKATFTFPILADGIYKATLIDTTVTVVRFNVQGADAISVGISDDKVDFTDFSFLSFSFGTSAASGTVPSPADFNGDGKVDFVDFSFLSFKFGDSLAGFLLPPPPPAPAALAVDLAFGDQDGDDDDEDEDFFGLV